MTGDYKETRVDWRVQIFKVSRVTLEKLILFVSDYVEQHFRILLIEKQNNRVKRHSKTKLK